jgi:hypothetical protein
MRISRQNVAPCGHPNPHGLTVVHNGHWACPHCAALRFFDLNQGIICAVARTEAFEGRPIDAVALCEQALACGPCRHPGTCAVRGPERAAS